MIEQLEVQGYRSLQGLSLRPGQLTCLIGPNGSGKSNILEVLELLRAAAGERLAAFVNERRGFDSIRWFGEDHSEVVIKARLRVVDGSSSSVLRYELKLGASGGSYVVAEEHLKPYRITAGKPTELIKNLGGAGNLHNDERKKPDRVPSRGDPGPGPRETFLGHFRAPRYYGVVSRTQEAIRSWSVLSFARIDTRPGSVVRSPRPLGESTRLQEDGSNLTDALAFLQARNPEAFAEVERVTRAAFREIQSLVVRPVVGTNQWVTRARVSGSAEEVPVWNFSDGVIRFLCLALSLLSPERSPVLILDEPEVGMHPAIAPNVVELMREAGGSGRRQVFVATHSADVVDQLAMRDVVVVEKDRETGATQARPLASDTELKDWIGEYRLGELWREGQLGGRP